MSASLENVILYYQRSIEKNGHDEKRLLHCIEKLYKLPVKLEHLQSTGVGKTVNSLRKFKKEVGYAAKALVAKWKAMVAAEAEISEYEEDGNDSIEPDNDADDDPHVIQSHHSKTDNHHRNLKSKEHRTSSSKKDHKSSSKSKEKLSKDTETSGNRKSHNYKSSTHDLVSKEHCHDKVNNSDKKHKSSSEKSSSSDNQMEERQLKKSIVEEIEQDFAVDESQDSDDEDDDEKLVIDVGKPKTEDADKSSSFESQSSHKMHHRSTEYKTDLSSSKHRSTSDAHSSSTERSDRYRDTVKRESSDRKKTSKTEVSSDRESAKKDSGSTKDNSRSYHRSKDKRRSKERHDRDKVSDKSSKEKHVSPDSTHSKSDSKESKSESDKKHISSSHKLNGERHKSRHKHEEKKHERDNEASHKRKYQDLNTESGESKAKVPKITVDGIDSSMGTSFEEALGMIPVKTPKNTPKMRSPKNNTNSFSSNALPPIVKQEICSPITSMTPPLLSSSAKLEPLDPSIALDLPTISPNYKPMPLNPTVMECVFSSNKPQRRMFTDEEAMSAGISSKTIRTKVYSGVKPKSLCQVPSLFDLCIRLLQKNIDALEYTGGVPFEVLKPVLERATPHQLLIFEEYNPYLMDDSDILWQQHCIKFYRGKTREEFESWREMFLRCKEEQERKLNLLAENIKQSQKQIMLPVRKTQLAYVDTMVKPPRNIQRKQEIYGTKSNVAATPAARVAALSNISSSNGKIGEKRPREPVGSPNISPLGNNGRPKKAPLMQKTIKFMKGRFKR